MNNQINDQEEKQPEITVIPIQEVKADMGNNNKQPNRKSSAPLIILFIFLFAFVMGIPYINEWISNLKSNSGLSPIEQAAKDEEKRQQEEAKKSEPTSKQEEVLSEVTCTKSTTAANYSLIEKQSFSYNKNNEVKKSSYTYQYNFENQDDTYTQLTTKCSEDSLKYIEKEGYTMACNYSENQIEINHEFDLSGFKTIIDGDTKIEANAVYKEKLKTKTEELIKTGYTCK